MGIIKSAINGAMDSIKSPLKVVKSASKGDFSQAFKDLKAIPGNQERANSETLRKAGIRGWVGDNPGSAVGAAFAAYFGGSALMGAGGSSGAAGASAGASGGGSGVGSLLGSGSSPGGGIMGSISNFAGGSTGGFSNAGMLNSGMSLFGSLTGFLSERSQAKALKKAQDEQWKEQVVATREAYKQIGQEETAANKQFHSDVLSNKVSLLQQQAQVELMAGASGTGGQSISSMLSDLSAQGGTNQANILDSHENQQINFTNQLKSVQSNNQMVMREFKKPSAFGALSKGISDMAGSYMSAAKTGKEFSKAYNDSRTYSSGVGS